jgi:hypothetical protein
MTYRTPRIVGALAFFVLPLLTGCWHETWTYRAVPNVTISRPHELGSQGPLVLVSMDDPGYMPKVTPRADVRDTSVDALTTKQIAQFDPQMAKLLEKLAAAKANLDKAQAETQQQTPKVLDARNAVREIQDSVDDYAKEYRATTRKRMQTQTAAPAREAAAQPQTILVGAVQRDYGAYDNSIGRSFVLFIDGSPQPGTYWLNNENSSLITYSAWTAPARTHIGLTGSVRIVKVDGNKIEADVAIRENWEGDSVQSLGHYYDPAYWQAPWVVQGRRTFLITTKDDPALRKAAVQWITPERD